MPLATQNYTIQAKKDDFKILADILQVPEVNSLKAEIFMKVERDKNLLFCWGHIKSELVLQSVVSLEYFPQGYDFDFENLYDLAASYDSQKEESDDLNDDLPEVIIDGKLDLADIVLEQIALHIDDYPRKSGEAFSFNIEFDDSDVVKNNPFDVLAKLKK